MACGVGLVGLLGGCSATTSNVVVGPIRVTQAVVQSDGDLSLGDVVHIWHRRCRWIRRCGYARAGDGVVTGLIGDSANYAVIELAPDARVRDGDRAVKDSPMFYWHPDPPID